ncbi:MAG: energy transducer TonB [Anaerovibrio sp.]|uniref:energy transducer TonB n=1 Tax=Anaerovibrio sp. TaxID=1872532 RepID=UPI0025F9556B|nr:energy transducer TonB [Anaerovibrio sp.]MCR5176586.1 energy transducer TonB [Anaerovibrio sp.]
MIPDKKREYRAWCISLGIHVVLFILVSFTGLFAIAATKEDKPVDVTLYDADAGKSAGASGAGSSASAAPPPPAPPSIDDVVIKKKQTEKLPEIEEKFTKEPEKQEEFKKEHNAPVAVNPVFAVGATGNGLGPGIFAGTGSGDGVGNNGNGTGNGSGDGNGNGNGSGNGSGDGNGNGIRPAIAPELISAPEPVYPESLRKKNIHGKVIVRITVGTSGGVESAEVISSSGYGEMDQAALDAAWGYRYTTAYNEHGEAVSFRKRVKITFKLR